MTKHHPVTKAPPGPEPTQLEEVLPMPSASTEPGSPPSFWILKDATAKKLGKRSEGSINYQVLTGADRLHLFIAITGNASGGYFSRERVPFEKVQECLGSFPIKPFPSKALRGAFFGRSSNNPGFLAAVLTAEGLIGADATTESLHTVVGNWTEFEREMLALPGTLLQIEVDLPPPDAGDAVDRPTQTAPSVLTPSEN